MKLVSTSFFIMARKKLPVLKRKLKALSFMNSYTQGSSGGDVLFVELTKRWKGVEHTVCTSALGEQFCKMKGLTDAHFVISTEETESCAQTSPSNFPPYQIHPRTVCHRIS